MDILCENGKRGNKFYAKNEQLFVCEHRDVKCSFKSDFNRYLSTCKHSDSLNGNLVEMKKTHFDCKCGKEYKSMSGLWKHKNNSINNIIYTNNIIKK